MNYSCNTQKLILKSTLLSFFGNEEKNKAEEKEQNKDNMVEYETIQG